MAYLFNKQPLKTVWTTHKHRICPPKANVQVVKRNMKYEKIKLPDSKNVQRMRNTCGMLL